MKRTIFVLAFSLILTLSLCGSAFASETNDMNTNTTNTNVSQQGVENSSLIQSTTLKSSKTLTATAKRSKTNSAYITITFTNNTASKITETCTLADAASNGEVISGPFNISVKAGLSKSYDVYVGNNQPDYYLITQTHGTFVFDV